MKQKTKGKLKKLAGDLAFAVPVALGVFFLATYVLVPLLGL